MWEWEVVKAHLEVLDRIKSEVDFICVVIFLLCERKMVSKCFPTIGTARKIVERWFFQAYSKTRLPIFRGADVHGEELPATMCSLLCTIQMI